MSRREAPGLRIGEVLKMGNDLCRRFNWRVSPSGLLLPAILALLPLAAAAAESAPGPAPIQVKCGPPAAPITIDGVSKEWEADSAQVINKNTAFGCRRDAGFLYVHLVTTDPEFSMQMMNFGLTLWLDPDGTRKKAAGVQFPVILLQPPPPREGGKPPRGEELKKFLDKRLKDIVVEFPGLKEMKQLDRPGANKHGLDVMIGVDTEKAAISYELKYPLRGSPAADAMGLELGAQKLLDICMETPEVNPAKLLEKAPDGGERPQKPPEGPRPPKPSKKPPLGRISQCVKAVF